MRRLIAAAVLAAAVAGSVACTPEEIAVHRLLVDDATAAGLSCPDAAGWVRVAGFNEHEARTVHRLMWAESRCDSNAVGRAGEIGAMQIHPRSWLRALCQAAIACTRAELHDLATNLRAARYVFEHTGFDFGAWTTY